MGAHLVSVASCLRMDCHRMMYQRNERIHILERKKCIFLTSSTVKSRQANVSLKPPVTSTLGFANKSRARTGKPTRARILSTAFNHIDGV